MVDDFSRSIDLDETGTGWAEMSLHSSRINVVFVNAGRKTTDGSVSLIGTLDKEVLGLYFSLGLNANSAQVKNVDVPIFKQPIQEAANELLLLGDDRPTFEAVLRDFRNAKQFDDVRKESVKAIKTRWVSLKIEDTFIKAAGKAVSRKLKKTIITGWEKIGSNKNLYSHQGNAAVSAVNGDMFTLVSLCFYDKKALEQLKKLFVLPQPTFEQRVNPDRELKLFTSGNWISCAIVENLGKIYKMIQKRLIFEALLLLAAEEVQGHGIIEQRDLNRCYDGASREWTFEVGFFKGMDGPHSKNLETEFGPKGEGKSVNLSRVGLDKAKHTKQDAWIARMIVSYLFSDLVDCIHRYGYDFRYPSENPEEVAPAAENPERIPPAAESNENEVAPEVNADPILEETKDSAVDASEVMDSSNESEEEADSNVGAFPEHVEGLVSPEANCDIMESFLNNKDLKSMYSVEQIGSKGWEGKHTFEVFVFCWSDWLCEKLEYSERPRKFTIMRALGGTRTQELNDIQFRMHNYSTPASDLTGFDSMKLSSFLGRALEPGGFAKLVKEGMGSAANFLQSGKSGKFQPVAAHSTAGDMSSVGVHSVTGVAAAKAAPSASVAVGSVSVTEQQKQAAPGSTKTKPTPIKKKQGKRRKQETVSAGAASGDNEFTKMVTKSANRSFQNACFGKDPLVVEAITGDMLQFMAQRKLLKKVTFSDNIIRELNKLHANNITIPGTVRNFFCQAEADNIGKKQERIVEFTKDRTTMIGLSRKKKRESGRLQKKKSVEDDEEEDDSEDSSGNSDDDDDDDDSDNEHKPSANDSDESDDSNESDDEQGKSRKRKAKSSTEEKPAKRNRPDDDEGDGPSGDASGSNNGHTGDRPGEGAGDGNAEGDDHDNNSNRHGHGNENNENVQTEVIGDRVQVFVSSTDSEAGPMPKASNNLINSFQTIRFQNFPGKFGRVPQDEDSNVSGSDTPLSFTRKMADELELFHPVNTAAQNPYHDCF